LILIKLTQRRRDAKIKTG